MTNYYRKDIFPFHLYQTNLKNNQKIKSKILSSIIQCHQEKNLPIPDGWSTNCIYTTFDYPDLNSNIFSPEFVSEFYFPPILKFFDQPVDFNIREIWFNHYTKGEYQESHHHVPRNSLDGNIHYACIHFLSFDENIHEPVRFVDPNRVIRSLSVSMESEGYNEHYKPRIHEGDFIMFPSYLEHLVLPSEPSPNYPRITVSMNVEIMNYGNTLSQ